ncbi:MAG: glycosyltransferase [Nostoc sp.]|uniref:glycosyltransferase family 2 protein n=1 Tax=Nostoc sp. TaxID=1180 RepID=UPI002FF65CE0
MPHRFTQTLSSGELFMLQLEKTENRASICYPTSYYSPACVAGHLQQFQQPVHWHLSENADTCTLDIETKAGALDATLQTLFAQLNGYPSFTEVDIDAFKNSQLPLMSCIILLTANDEFVANHLIPSIIHNSRGYEIEIRLVYNGLGADLRRFQNFDVACSEFACVSKGYNLGARRSRGKYLAIFHDDCIVADPNWIPKCLTLFENGYVAVTPEIEGNLGLGIQHPLLTLKNVPLVIEREQFFQLGGYDENYYVGYEDVDFTYHLLEREQAFSKVEMHYFHFNGMSTILLFGNNLPYFKQLFAYHLLPKKIIFDLRTFYIQKLIQNAEISWLNKQQLLYFLSKFEQYWQKISYETAIAFQQQLSAQLPSPTHGLMPEKRGNLIELVRGFCVIA